jgi:hypothetical protein
MLPLRADLATATLVRPARDIEHREQVRLFRRCESERAQHPELDDLYAIPNGGKRDKITAARLKAEGVKAGTPDLHLPHARSGYHSLYVEMKAEWMEPHPEKPGESRRQRNYPSPSQRERARRLIAAGNAFEVAWSADEAWIVLTNYLAGLYCQTYEP